MTPELANRIVEGLRTANMILDGCAKRSNPGEAKRLYAFIERFDGLLKEADADAPKLIAGGDESLGAI